MNSNDLIDSLIKKPETMKEKLLDFRYTFFVYYPDRIKHFFHSIGLFFRNIFKYRKILWTDYDWDFGYLDSIVLTKLEKMADYFRTSRLAVGNELRYERINKTVNIGRIAFDLDNVKDVPEVNLKNLRRFCPTQEDYNFMINMLNGTERNRQYAIENLRQRKARYLFYSMILNYEEDWWD